MTTSIPGISVDGYESGQRKHRDESTIWKPQGVGTVHGAGHGGYVPLGNEQQRQVLTYPPGEDVAVSVADRDMESLQPKCWLRDNIIDFYIMYLERNLSLEFKGYVYFFNSFFFTKPVESTTHGKIGYEQVRSWTKDVNLFEKEYIFIPVNQRYIIEVWKEKYHAGSDDSLGSLCLMKFEQAEVPQQDNGYDCGIYLLHYVERFLQNIKSILMDDNRPTNQIPGIWFEPSEVSMKRKEIEDIIISLSQGDKGAQCAGTKPVHDQTVIEPAVHKHEGLPVTSLSSPKRDKRKRNSNWTNEETSILVNCKKEAAVGNGSRFCKGKRDVTNWDAIAEEINSKLGTISVLKTGDQCRLRWDTLVKSYQRIKEHCRRSGKEFSELTRNERVELKLATTLSIDEWYAVIDQFCPPKSRKSKSQKLDNVVPCVETLPWSLRNSTHFRSPMELGIGSFEAKEAATKEANVQEVSGDFSVTASDMESGDSDPPEQSGQHRKMMEDILYENLIPKLAGPSHLGKMYPQPGGGGPLLGLCRKMDWRRTYLDGVS